MAGGAADAGGGDGATSCGQSKASRLRPGRRSARVTITTTFDQLRTTTEPPAAGAPAPSSQPPDWGAFAPARSAVAEPPEEATPGLRASLQVTEPEPAAQPQWQPFGSAETSGQGWRDMTDTGWLTGNGVDGRDVPGTGWLGGTGPESGKGWPASAQREGNPDWLGGTASATRNGWPVAAGQSGLSYPRDPSPSYSDQLGPISPGTLARLACDASFERAVLNAKGAILELGQGIRLASPAQRRAVSVRDGGCARPGCNRPASWCDIHHIIWYSRGGPTDINNLAGFCPSDHSLIHAGFLEATMVDGIPYVRYGPNARNRTILNPYQSASTNDWTRNTYFDDLKDAKNVARIIISAA